MNGRQKINALTDCNTDPHNTNHLFNCQMKPTSLTPTVFLSDPDLEASLPDLDQSGVTQIKGPI